MLILIAAFGAGVLTVLAPCVLPLLPVIIGGTVVDRGQSYRHRAWMITLGLAVSVVAFTLALKATTALLGVPQMVWQILSGLIIFAFGIFYLWPNLWEKVAELFHLQQRTTSVLQTTSRRPGIMGDFLLGAALGPVFSSCSPTYGLIVATVLPASFTQGLSALIAYAAGLALMLLLISVMGRRLVHRLGWLSNSNGWFKRTVGFLFIVVAILVIFGFDKDIQAFVLSRGWYDPIVGLEAVLPR